MLNYLIDIYEYCSKIFPTIKCFKSYKRYSYKIKLLAPSIFNFLVDFESFDSDDNGSFAGNSSIGVDALLLFIFCYIPSFVVALDSDAWLPSSSSNLLLPL
ncbi:unnamed protein product [Rotaria sp. Silwood1]|nr:unnamed protein product [Rotaria sp. Silwood1]CAF1061665.1 unnamed protein product [Rotaria sp. Silwood1]CAF3404747.1 unnamed protein product [Rotaria sp. Silwood1]CAF3417759.1 unnamed protein product [Rotaria sp. Silwood1]CAF3457181.1 unnamed protein product [Rotaria sp. Silwood1]